MFDPETERWPPTYDFEQLAAQITSIVGSPAIVEGFYTPLESRSTWCQGDVLRLDCGVPVINQEGAAEELDSDSMWLVIGNSCDIDRSIARVTWTQLVPAVDIGQDADLSAERLASLRRYSQYRSFYLPPWHGEARHFLADFLRPVALHKQALSRCTRLATLSYRSWVLLHSCLVRFLARDDGRNEPA
jgi:hypothetical protein